MTFSDASALSRMKSELVKYCAEVFLNEAFELVFLYSQCNLVADWYLQSPDHLLPLSLSVCLRILRYRQTMLQRAEDRQDHLCPGMRCVVDVEERTAAGKLETQHGEQ